MGVEYLDFTTSSKYIHNNELYVDGVHLNAKGAVEFSRDLMKTLTSKNQGDEWKSCEKPITFAGANYLIT